MIIWEKNQEYTYMVQFCPKCGTKDPDDQAVFCNRCGNRLPPPVPEKREKICPGCGTKISDIKAVFCDRCGSPLPPPPPEPVRHGAPPAAARPVITWERCPSCGAPFVDEISDYCNVCGAHLRGSAPVSAVRENTQRYPETPEPAPLATAREPYQPPPGKPAPGTPVARRPGDGSDKPVTKKSRRPLLKWGLIALAAVIILVIMGAFFSGMIPGFSQSSNTTSGPDNQESGTAPPTLETTQPQTPMPTPSPAQTTATPVPSPVITTNASLDVTTNASTTVTTNASAPSAANASGTVTATLTITSSSQPLSVGQSAYDGKGTLTVNDFTFKDKMSDPIPSYAVGKQYLIINITYENLQQNETVDAGLSQMKVTDGGGFPYDPASDTLLENVYTGISILPQEKRTGNLLFIVPVGATYLKLEYSFGNQSTIKFQLT